MHTEAATKVMMVEERKVQQQKQHKHIQQTFMIRGKRKRFFPLLGVILASLLFNAATAVHANSHDVLQQQQRLQRQRSVKEDERESRNKKSTSIPTTSPTIAPTIAPTKKQAMSKNTASTNDKEDDEEIEEEEEDKQVNAVSSNILVDEIDTEELFVSQAGGNSEEQDINENKAEDNQRETTSNPTASPTIPKFPRQVDAPTVAPVARSPFIDIIPPALLPSIQVPQFVPTIPPAVDIEPTMAPAPVVVVEPTSSPTDAPVGEPPSEEPTVAPSEAVAPSLPPMEESDEPTSVPSVAPTISMKPTIPNVTTAMPSGFPSSIPTILNISEFPSSMPSDDISMAPTTDGYIFMNITINGIVQIQYKNLSLSSGISDNNTTLLNDTEIMLLEVYTEQWFNDYYNNLTTSIDITDVFSSSATTNSNNGNRFLYDEYHLRRFQTEQLNVTTTTNITDDDSNSTSNMTLTNMTMAISIRDMVTTITITSQNSSGVTSDDNGYSNVIVQYEQILEFYYLPIDYNTTTNASIPTITALVGDDLTIEEHLAEFLVIYPFRQIADVEEYRTILQTNIVPTFETVAKIEQPIVVDPPPDVPSTSAPVVIPPVPIPAPVPVPAPVVEPPVVPTEKDILSSGAIAGIAVVCFIAISLIVYGIIIYPQQRKSRASAAAVAASAPVIPVVPFSDMGDNGKMKNDLVVADKDPIPADDTSKNILKSITTKQPNYAEETSTIGGFSDDGGASYEGKSIDTSEFDYNQVAHGAAPAAVSGAAAASMAATSVTGSDMIPDESQYVIYAPAGKLGLVVDNPDDGAPVVHAIKEDSVLLGQIHVGDRLIGVDEVDVRKLSPVKVSKLISKRSNNPLRKLTLVRGKGDYDDETATDGGESSISHTIDTSSQMDVDETRSGNLGIPPNPNNIATSITDDDDTSHVESMSRLSGDEAEDDTEEEEEQVEEESVMDYPDDTSSVVDAMSQTSGYGGIVPATVDETKHDDNGDVNSTATDTAMPVPTTKVGEDTSEQQHSTITKG